MIKDYRELDINDKKSIVEYYYNNKDKTFKEISLELNVSKRSISRVLKEENINTKLKNRYTLNEDYFNIIDTEAKAYILGFIYADGFVGDDNFNNVVISINDLDILQEIVKEIEFSGDIRRSKKGGFANSKEGYCLNFSSKKMATQLRKLGLYPNKSLTMTKLPNIGNNLIRHFIRGYFDGDGSIVLSHNSSYYRYNKKVIKYIYPTYCFMILGTELFLKDILKYSELKYAKITNTKTEEIKCIKISAKREFENIFKYLYEDSTIRLERKYNKWNEIRSAFVEKPTKQIG